MINLLLRMYGDWNVANQILLDQCHIENPESARDNGRMASMQYVEKQSAATYLVHVFKYILRLKSNQVSEFKALFYPFRTPSVLTRTHDVNRVRLR